MRNAPDEARPGGSAPKPAQVLQGAKPECAHHPLAVPAKTLGYAKCDFVRVLNKSLDTLGLRGSIVEVLARTLAVPAARFFRMRRSVSLLISERPDGTHGLIEGTYQSPILVQWDRAPRETRVLDVTLSELR